jgi:hypothetical protein
VVFIESKIGDGGRSFVPAHLRIDCRNDVQQIDLRGADPYRILMQGLLPAKREGKETRDILDLGLDLYDFGVLIRRWATLSSCHSDGEVQGRPLIDLR